MKLLVFSDSHGSPARMLRAITQEKPDMIIHLGDGGREISEIERQFPQTELKAVRGNCDICSVLPESEFFRIGKTKFFITHGHNYGVKWTLSTLIEEAAARGANFVMFGHTHVAHFSTASGIYVLNPGSCGPSPAPSYAEIILDETNEPACRIVRF